MQWFKIFLIGLAALSAGPSSAQSAEQSPFFEVRPQLPEPDKGSGYYKRNSNRAYKDEKFRESALYALAWLVSEEKEKKKRKAHEQLIDALPLALSQSEEELKEMEAETADFKGKLTVSSLQLQKRVYLELIELQGQHGNLPEKWKVKNASFPPDYDIRLKEANRSLESAITGVAEGFYQEALELEQQGPSSRKDYLKIARTFRQCRRYMPQYKDAEMRYTECKQRATTRLAFADIQNQTGYEGLFTTQIREKAYEEMRKKVGANSLDFFELVPLMYAESPEKYNVRYELEILAIKVNPKINEPIEKKRQKAVGEEKSEKTITGYYVTHSKEASVSVEAKYRIVDSETNEVLVSNALVTKPIVAWRHSWHTARGNKEALNKREKQRVNSKVKDVPFPNNIELVQTAVQNNSFHKEIAETIWPFASSNGR